MSDKTGYNSTNCKNYNEDKKNLHNNCCLEVDMPKDENFKFDYDEFIKNMKKIQEGQVEAGESKIRELYKNQRIKGHEMAEYIIQLEIASMQTAPGIVLELAKLNPKTNPFYKHQLALKKGELTALQSKLNESCAKQELVETQKRSYEVQNKVEVVKVVTSMWSTHYTNAKVLAAPEVTQAANMDELVGELVEFISDNDTNKKPFDADLKDKNNGNADLGDAD